MRSSLAMKSIRLVAVTSCALAAACTRGPDGPQGGTLGFAVVSRMPALYETKHMSECPRGLAMSNYSTWWLGLSRAERDQVSKMNPPRIRLRAAALRGPGGENLCWNPGLVKDPAMPLVESEIAYGMNLDGGESGNGAPPSCPHENFVSPEGVRGVDNQMYRILGCIYGWRRHGEFESNADEERRTTSQGIMLIEVSGVDDVRHDDHVQIAFYKKGGRDPLPKDSQGRILPHASYRIDPTPRYQGVTRGRIVNGVLTSEPIDDMHWASFGNESYEDLHLRSMRIELPIEPGARAVRGLLAGYYTFDSWWNYIAKAETHSGAGHFSCPAMYEASLKLADGYPDPATGRCTALSSAFHIEAVPAFIQKPAVLPSSSDTVFETELVAAQHIPNPPEAIVRSSEAGWYVQDSRGMTLYTYEQDGHTNKTSCNLGPLATYTTCTASSPSEQAVRRGESACTGECEREWPPLAAPDDAVAFEDWSPITRHDGSKQWAYKGRPLYRNARDTYPGARSGEEGGSADAWRVAFWPRATPQNVRIARTIVGRVLANAGYMTLYSVDTDAAREDSGCAGDCLKHWLPHPAGWMSQSIDGWSTITRADGTNQWAYQGRALYTYELDVAPGDIKGQAAGGTVAILERFVDRPAWITVQTSDMGRVFADAKGLTLYAFAGDRAQVTRETCNAACWRTYWHPVLAAPGERPAGNWSLIDTRDGRQQWAYKTDPVYTHSRDSRPGEVYGQLFGAGMSILGPWRPILDPSEREGAR